MGNFHDVLEILLSIFPNWLVTVFLVAIACVAVLIVLSLIKAILDAIPFV